MTMDIYLLDVLCFSGDESVHNQYTKHCYGETGCKMLDSVLAVNNCRCLCQFVLKFTHSRWREVLKLHADNGRADICMTPSTVLRAIHIRTLSTDSVTLDSFAHIRSEERRVGKECRL